MIHSYLRKSQYGIMKFRERVMIMVSELTDTVEDKSVRTDLLIYMGTINQLDGLFIKLV